MIFNKLIFLHKSPPSAENLCLKFTSDEQIKISMASKTWDGILEYSTDMITWNVWDGTVKTSVIDNDLHIIYLRGLNNTVISGGGGRLLYVRTDNNHSINCYGNIETLLDYEMVAAGIHPKMGPYCFYKLFKENLLASAPSLPATTLSEHCYDSMFYYCTELITPPTLPAIILAPYCYSEMFCECSSMTSAPVLNAPILAAHCYERMFAQCKFSTAPSLPSVILADYCYSGMFNGASITSAPVLNAIDLKPYCYCGMFEACTHLIMAPSLPSTSLSTSCYERMFGMCSSLIKAPALPATTMRYKCYKSMFYLCTSILTPPGLPATVLAQYCYDDMFDRCSSLSCLPELPATQLYAYCYESMFVSCSSIKVSRTSTSEYCYEYRIPTSETGRSATSATSGMFEFTGGTFTSTPSINTKYYTNSKPISPQVEIVPWSTGTDEQITAMIEALDNGALTFAETGWSVGDVRTVQLSATARDYDRDIEAHAAQPAELVIMDTTCAGFTVNGHAPHAIVGLKDGLLETGQMNSGGTTEGGWRDCKRRSWCNTEFRTSLPSTVRNWFKQFSWSQGMGGSASSGLYETSDYFGLPPEGGVFDTSHASFSDEFALYTQWEYYAEESHRIKKTGISGETEYWWEVSPCDPYNFCRVTHLGIGYKNLANFSLLLSPFGCI